MTAKPATVAASPGNFMQSFVSGNLIKFLDDEFDKFEAQAKNCDRYTILDVKLPVRIIELFLKLFQLCVDNPVLRQNIDSVELFAKIFLLMRTHFKAQCPCGLDVDYEDDEDEDEDDDDYFDCNETDPLKRFFHYISQQQVKEKMSLEEATKKKQLKDVRHAKDWLLEQNGILICEICNSKCSSIPNVIAHSKLDSHNKNLDIFKDNEAYTAFPDSKIESYGCKACKSEYSTFSSLIKHFEKSQHKDVIQKLLVAVTKTGNVQVNGDSAMTTKLPIVQAQPVTNNSSSGTSVMIKYKAKKVVNVDTKTADNAPAKPQEKNATSETSKVKTKAADIISTKSQEQNTTSGATKNQTRAANNVLIKPADKNTTSGAPKADTKAANKVSTKPAEKNTTSGAPKPDTKAADNVSTKSQAKNTTKVAPKPETKPPNNNSTKQAKITNDTPKIDSKASTAAGKAPPKAKTTKPEYSMKFIVSKDSSGKYCQICDRKLPDQAAILAHVKAPDHLKMISTFESNQEYVKTSINCDDFICIMCCMHHSDLHDLACHFQEKHHVDLLKASKSPPAPATPAKPVLKPVSKNILKNAQLSDTDKKYFRQKGALARCIVCDVTCNKTSDVTEHINDQKHSRNVLDCIKHEEYIQLSTDEVASFSCLKCTSVFDSLSGILTHCQDHIAPKPKPSEFKLKKIDEKFISKGKTEKSSRCNLCDKELPTEAALVSHTGSSTHTKNSATFAKNEPYCAAGKTSCSLCEVTFQDLASLVKHFKTDIHQKATVKGKKPTNQTSVHIPSYAKPKLDTMMVTSSPAKSPKPTTPKKDKKEDAPVRKSRLQFFSMSDANLDELTSYEQFPMKRPDNSYIIAKNDVFYCRLCDVDLPAVTVAAHMNGATHRINKEVYESLQRHVLSTSDYVQCTLCKVTFHHTHELVKHFREKIHAKPVEKPKAPEPPAPPSFVFGASENGPVEKPAPEIAPSIEGKPPEKPVPEVPPPIEAKAPENPASEVPPSIEAKAPENPASEVLPSIEVEPLEKPSPEIPPLMEVKPPEKPVSPKRVRIPKNDRKHIFRLTETIVQCNLCNTKLPDNEALESHVNNLNHKRNSTLYQENESLIRQLDNIGSIFECVSCAFSGDLNKVIKHCKKKQHQVAKGSDEVSDDEIPEEIPDVDLTITEFDLKCISMKNGIVRCKLCHSKLSGEKNLLEHMNSINHKKFASIYKTNESYIEQFDEFGYSYKCTICEVIFTRLDTMIRHFEVCQVPVSEEKPQVPSPNARFNVTTYDFECILCSTTFCGFADFSKHCYSAQHEVMKNSIQSEQNEIPYNITITDYVYHCNACDIRLINRALMEKHQKKRIHEESATFFRERRKGDPIIEIVGYEYLCNLCWFPMYSAAELAVHERSNMHKSGKNFDDVWRFNERHLIMCESMYKVRCRLCMKTIGIEKLIKHCTSRDHRLKFIANHLEENTQDQHIVWRNNIQYCTLCDCKLINNHNLVNHVNSEKHKSRLLLN